MWTTRTVPSCGALLAFAVSLVATSAATVGAQPSSAPPAPVGAVVGTTVTNHYVFRGVRQNATGVAVRPFADLEFMPYSGDATLEQIVVRVGFWNSLNSGDTGAGGPADAPWYESRVSGGVGVRLSGDVMLSSSVTAYSSPNGMFSRVTELGFRVGWDDRARHRLSLNPYAALALEVGAQPGRGQLDGGRRAGRYLEVGAAPTYVAGRVSVALPVTVGVSVRDYYELAGRDHRLGFVSAGTDVLVQLGRTLGGRWSLRGGVEALRLGETTRVFNDGKRSLLVGSVGLVISR